ncbi:cobalt-precorrin-5B (C(1))-methyltransferase CbiD [Deltaproteobacteria bacterium TL4]
MEATYVIKHGKQLRKGYTTGSCAAGAAKAAAMMLVSQKVVDLVEIETPAGVKLQLSVLDTEITNESASCAVVKDSGDDPDVTDKVKIYATVKKRSDGEIIIEGGQGIGRITRAGFIGTPGDAAINPVPRKMIGEEVGRVAKHGWDVLIYCPEGEAIAKKTFNANLGITGGISILGTTGIVDPMSEEAWKQSVFLEIDAIEFAKSPEIILYLGNYGQRLIAQLALTAPSVKISNFIGETLLYCQTQSFEKVTLIGHIGKLSKLALGAFNTHSKVCDTRIEAFVYYLALAGAPLSLLHQVNQCATAEEALRYLIKEDAYATIFHEMELGCVERIRRYLKDPEFNIQVILFSIDYGLLGSARS